MSNAGTEYPHIMEDTIISLQAFYKDLSGAIISDIKGEIKIPYEDRILVVEFWWDASLNALGFKEKK